MNEDVSNTPISGGHSMSPLLDCLLQVCRHYKIPATPSKLAAGLPLDNGQLTPAVFIKAASRAGLSARYLTISLDELNPLVLPVVLILQNNKACVVTRIDHEQGKARILTPEAGDGSGFIDLHSLEQLHTGEALFIKEQHQYDERTPETLDLPERHWFWGTLRHSMPIYRDVIIASIVINLFVIVSPLFVMNVYDRVVPNNSIDTLWVLAIGASIAYVFDFLLKSARAYFIDLAGKKSDILLSARLFEQSMSIQLAARPASVGSFARHLQEFDYIREFITSSTIATLVDLPFCLFILIIVAILGGPVVLVPVAAMIILTIHGFAIQPSLRAAIENTQRTGAQKHATLIETLCGIEGVKAQSAESELQHRWEKLSGHIARWDIKSRILTTSASNLSASMIQLTTIGIIVVGVYRIMDLQMSMGALIAVVLLSSRALAPIAQLSALSTRFYQAKSALSALNKVMELPQEHLNHDSCITTPNCDEGITLNKVSFAYPGEQRVALNEVSLHIKSGEKVAIIGRIGSGKSTLQKLLLRFFTPLSGQIKIDQIDIQQISPHELRQQIGYVAQDTTLFFGSVRDNIALGSGHVSDDQILHTARLCGVTNFTDAHPKGLQMPVAERGINLSGGQRQSIALARALLNDPPILLMDEPFSAMDSVTEYQICERLQKIIQKKTLLMTTYKSSMLNMVDRLIVLEEGKVIADGPRDKVLNALNQGSAE
ncbi:ABC transporter [Endozoicomonas sp. (ex Bugula neritina AB1)]|nr:ABC transporter [Endozoicomonas sp. (ex Bugula neritina AB1)]